jgi:hypothetical protein
MEAKAKLCFDSIGFYFAAFSSREAVSTSPENAIRRVRAMWNLAV